MEAATISSPQRKVNVPPAQKSLSLPSYARAGGEGIDHRIIFAALEQREKIRRKSRIFTREKSVRQNLFCLPISSGNKCRETSLSSDTSCSSLEYQKPKSKPKKDDKQTANEPIVNEPKTIKTNQPEFKSKQISPKDATPRTVDLEVELQKNSLNVDHRKDHRSPDSLRPNVNSSDSMERSSRSSNDSLSRKERLVAIKAKVEAAREKYGEFSSDDESHISITRYNSDGVIHRSVREVKSRSYRLEKRLRRRSQDEYALKKANRKNNFSLCLNSLDDGIKLDLNGPLDVFQDCQTTECKTDFCPSPNFLDFTKKNYFSDFPCKENMSRVVQARVRLIEEEERKRRNSTDFRDKSKISSRQSPQNTENSSPFSTERRNVFSSQNALSSLDKEKATPCLDALHCTSPVGRAPTPPPRSPKSITFINKVYKQHQNAYLNHDSHSLERKQFFQPNIPVTSPGKCVDQGNTNDSKVFLDLLEDSKEKRRMRELFNSRRKTCSYFDYGDSFSFKELNSSTAKASPVSPASGSNFNFSHSKPMDTKGYFSGSETPPALSDDSKWRLRRNRWEETEKRQEFMFNSLESKKKSLSPSWLKWSGMTESTEKCLCQIVSGSTSCTCNYGDKNMNNRLRSSSSASNKPDNSSKYVSVNTPGQSCRLSKSEMNIAYAEQSKPSIQTVKSENLLHDFPSMQAKASNETHVQSEKLTATANLDSAMEELESVYRSLKFSSDNLSEKNSASNLSLNDLNVETSKNDILNHAANDLQFIHSSRENNFNVYNNSKFSNSKPVDEKKPYELLKLSVYSPFQEKPNSPSCKSPEAEALCIDELFSDLTRQLDIEQKLLKESRDNRHESRTPDLPCRNNSRTFDFQNDKCDIRDQKRPNPLESIVSIRKELYDNLQKSSQEQIRSYSPVPKVVDKTEGSQFEMAKRKFKAVRSLSENISYLMASTNPNPIKKTATEPSSCKMESLIMERSSPKHYDHVVLEPLKIETKKVALSQPIVPKRTYIPDKHKKPVADEIRQIRVSMDPNSPESTAGLMRDYPEYPRLSSAVCRPQISPKNETAVSIHPTCDSSQISKEPIDILDENGLEKLLNTLLNDVPEPKHSSLLMSRDGAPATPPPAASAGKSDHVKYKRNPFSSRMDRYMAASAKGQASAIECNQRLNSEEVIQVKNDYRQNSAHLNQISFIPVYSSKTVCHNVPKSTNECENATSERKVLSTYSPPTRPRCAGDSDMLNTRFAKTHMRRRSVGFEDMTSLTSYYGHNFTNDRRFQGSVNNSNISQQSTENHSTFLLSDNAHSPEKLNQRENTLSSLNHNAQVTSAGNANDHLRRNERPLQRYKDKSSKRKSSLNRMDFINFPVSNTGNSQYSSDLSQKNSSSDEDSGSRFLSKKIESPSGTSKRKHSASNLSNTTSKTEVKTQEVNLRNNSPSKAKSNLLPKSSHLPSHANSRNLKWRQSPKVFSQKLSHSAGELESLTDCAEISTRNKTYMSAQEFDDSEGHRPSLNSGTSCGITARHKYHKGSPRLKKKQNSLPLTNTCDITSQVDNTKESTNEYSLIAKEHSSSDISLSLPNSCSFSLTGDQNKDISIEICSEQINFHDDIVNSDKNVNCDDSKVQDAEIEGSAIKLENLEITETSPKNTDVSGDESWDVVGSDGEKRRGSILRKKSSEERKELISILKPPPEDKLRAPLSILKHRESSEEKEIWQTNDLHSILKKSTSEDESCNSGPDIRPILKLSTDEDSPSGFMRPRPILKKRTSFSDECSYVSFPSGELKPILKKKTPLSSDEQPRPILKSRRKSEDSRSTTSEIITSRPRAYSADMGVKKSHESQNDSTDAKKDFRKADSHDL